MRNLRILRDHSPKLGSKLNGPVTAFAWDINSDALVFASGPSASSPTIQLRKTPIVPEDCDDPTSFIAAWDASSPLPDLEFDRIVNFHHFAETGVSCLVLAGGDVVNVSPGLESRVKIEIVGSVDGGITAAAWSPDEELLAITTRLDTVLFMTADFDCLASVNLTNEDANLSKHVSVGWGKSETQFKGKRAKAMRDPTMPDKIEQGTLSPFDGQEVSISWRGDGAYVAVNSIIDDGPRRIIRIFTRQALLESVSEPVDGLEGALSWRPAGNLIAGIQRLDSEANVVFFERNGLRHGQFSLRLTPDNHDQWSSHITLAWNPLSTVLAVSYENQVQLWTMGNYHYYLKQQISSWGENTTTAVSVKWHPEDSMRVSLLCNENAPSDRPVNGEAELSQISTSLLRDVQVGYTVASGPSVSPYELGLVAVIDGGLLKYTPLEEANIPPPMALHEVQIACPKDVAINDVNTILAALHEDSVTLIHMDRSAGSSEPKTIEIKPLLKKASQYSLQICSWKGGFYVLLLDRASMELNLYDVNNEKSCPIAGSTFHSYHLTASIDTQALYLLESTTVSCIKAASEVDTIQDVKGKVICRFPTQAAISKLEVVHREEVICFALTSNGTLYANTKQLLKNCTSFLTTQEYLIVTTTNHLLKVIHLAAASDLEVPEDNDENDERCRSIERGARIVTVMPSTFSLVLQMPRGNLETIYPRALVLASIRKNLEARKYRDAFLICRTQRVDMNIIHDYSPNQFLENIDAFVDQVKKIEHIDLFLSQLKNEDVSQTMYKETLLQYAKRDEGQETNHKTIDTSKEGGINNNSNLPHDNSKVNTICDAFLAVLQSKYSTHLQNIITAHVCKIPPNIEAGLRVAAGLREQQSELADQAVEHICFLADVNRVYESALGLYDLDLALLVAQQSQKDPREYLPYLQNLQTLGPLRTKFTIDDDLNRFDKALGHLKDMQEFEELKWYMQKHELYTEALKLYRYDQDSTTSVTRLYADYLSDKHRYKEAGIAYESLSDYSAASSAYRADNLWEQCLSTASMIPLPQSELKALASSLADQLSNTKDFHSSAIIHLDYLADVETSLSHFCKAHQFSTAIRIAALRGRPELLAQVIDPGLVESSATLTELLADCKAQLKAQVPRLQELRKAKASNPLAFFGGEGATSGNVDIPDDVSIAPSATSTAGGASLFTRYTQKSGLTNTVATGTSRKTSKNRRREERKRARGKKGSVYEEEYLVNSIARLIERVNDTASDVGSTVEGLLRRNMKERARAIEEAMEDVVRTCAECIAEVFELPQRDQPDLNGHADEDHAAESARPPGADGVLWDSMEEAKAARIVPVVKPYKRSGISY